MSSQKPYSYVVGSLVVLAILLPLAQYSKATPVDSFPLSYYPMFTKPRPDVSVIPRVAGFDAEGREIAIPMVLLGSERMNQARRLVSRAVAKGHDPSLKLCRKIAKRLAGSNDPELRSVRELRVLKSRYSAKTYLGGDTEPMAQKTVLACPIRRGGNQG